LTIVQKLISI